MAAGAYAFGLACAGEDALDHLLLLAEEVDHLHQTNSSRELILVSDDVEVFSCPVKSVRQASA